LWAGSSGKIWGLRLTRIFGSDIGVHELLFDLLVRSDRANQAAVLSSARILLDKRRKFAEFCTEGSLEDDLDNSQRELCWKYKFDTGINDHR
jgi:hypothetical protein